jgi:hypothetical protein
MRTQSNLRLGRSRRLFSANDGCEGFRPPRRHPRAQGNADGRQTLSQADGIDFAFGGAFDSKDTDAIAGGFFLKEIPNALRFDSDAHPLFQQLRRQHEFEAERDT